VAVSTRPPSRAPLCELCRPFDLGSARDQCSWECACVRRMWDGRREPVVDADPAVFCPNCQQCAGRSGEQGSATPSYRHRMARGRGRGSQVVCARQPWRRILVSVVPTFVTVNGGLYAEQPYSVRRQDGARVGQWHEDIDRGALPRQRDAAGRKHVGNDAAALQTMLPRSQSKRSAERGLFVPTSLPREKVRREWRLRPVQRGLQRALPRISFNC
jgi:hypothetical protein